MFVKDYVRWQLENINLFRTRAYKYVLGEHEIFVLAGSFFE